MIRNYSLHTFDTEKKWISAVLAEAFSDLPENFSMAFSGGSTPAPIYRALAEEKKDWEKTDIFVVDERFVPPSHNDSNEKLIRENFSVPANFHFWETENISWEESAKKYDELLKNWIEHSSPGEEPVSSEAALREELEGVDRKLDLIFLGMGPDGHTASLFPHSAALTETEKMATTATTDVFAVHERLTMTFPTIFSAKKIILLLKGSNKKEVLDELLHGEKTAEEFPAKKLLEHENVHIFFADV